MTRGNFPTFLWEVIRQLRRRRLPLGIDDYDALRLALAAGFGLSSDEELSRLLVALWAKSPEEAEIVRAALTRSDLEDWKLPTPTQGKGGSGPSPSTGPHGSRPADGNQPTPGRGVDEGAPQAKSVTGLGTPPPATGVVDRSLVLVPQYPLTEREIAQTWRRLRRPLRAGPAVELDVAGTIEQRSRCGVAIQPVLTPRRRNTAKLFLLIDRYGSMTPFHGYVDYIVHAIRNAGRIDNVREIYYHDLPGAATDRSILEHLEDPFRPDLDSVLTLIQPMGDGYVYDDPELALSRPLSTILEELTEDTATAIISDAGAARQQLDIIRLLDTVALLKALQSRVGAVSWLNPMPPDAWQHSTAGQVARYVPMFTLTREGLNGAVEALRGRPASVERPL